jgi:hypothetical protein
MEKTSFIAAALKKDLFRDFLSFLVSDKNANILELRQVRGEGLFVNPSVDYINRQTRPCLIKLFFWGGDILLQNKLECFAQGILIFLS